MPREKICRKCRTKYSMGVQSYEPPKCPSCGSGEWGYADVHTTPQDRRRRKGDYEPSKHGHFCNQADAMGNGCSDSWWTGGNYGGSLCRNPAHHDKQPCTEGCGREVYGTQPTKCNECWKASLPNA